MAEWATRIPAAIKRAEEGPQDDSYECGDAAHDDGCRCDIREGWPSATEVALAKGFLWAVEGDPEFSGQYEQLPALIAFTEKVEALDGGHKEPGVVPDSLRREVAAMRTEPVVGTDEGGELRPSGWGSS